MSDEMKDPRPENLRAVYQELCNSYRAIDDFRAKLLGFLPLATGTGVFLLVTDPSKIKFMQPLFRPIGAFGFIITLGLFFYELYGIKKCTHLIRAGIELENDLKIKSGQFTKRPPGVAKLINEPLAAGVIYPAVLAAWTFLFLACPQIQDAAQGQPQDAAPLKFRDAAQWWAIRVFLVGFAFSLFYNLILILEWDKRISVYLKTHSPSGRLAKAEGKADGPRIGI
jgi:hypothetical protein